MENNTNKRLVSIITPCYNCAKYVAETIESVLKQDYTNWELLLINDGSKDDTIDIIRSYEKKDPRIKVYGWESPSGSPVAPRNKGVDEAKGDYILFLDSDDVIKPTMLSDQIPLFSQKDVAVVFGNYQKMDDAGNISNNVIKCIERVDYKTHLRGCEILFSNAMFDFTKTGKRYFIHAGAEDYIYSLDILRDGFIARNTNKSNSIIRKHANSVSSNKLKSAMWNWNIYYHHEKLGLLKSLYYFSIYAFKGLIKYMKK